MNESIDFSALPLRDIHLPEPLAWWPPAPGWWIAAAVMLAAVAIGLVMRHRQRHRRAALAALEQVVAALEQGDEPVHCLQRASSVLRRYAMTVGRAATSPTIAGLTGERWLEYLDSRWERHAFATGAGRALTEAPYRRPEQVEREQALELSRLCANWVRGGRVER
jgi:hypothetical protein